ncbi:MAG: ATP-binding cassette domain-containing protein [Christensenellales bacterium]
MKATCVSAVPCPKRSPPTAFRMGSSISRRRMPRLPSAREFYGMVCGADVSAVMQLARAFRLGDAQLDGTNINTLSGGERKKVFLALALAAEPTILLMDEPTNSLDAASKTLLLSELKKRRGLSLIVTHDSIFDDVCDRVYFAERGTVIEHEKDKLA